MFVRCHDFSSARDLSSADRAKLALLCSHDASETVRQLATKSAALRHPAAVSSWDVSRTRKSLRKPNAMFLH